MTDVLFKVLLLQPQSPINLTCDILYKLLTHFVRGGYGSAIKKRPAEQDLFFGIRLAITSS